MSEEDESQETKEEKAPKETEGSVTVTVNGESVTMTGKQNYIFVDVFDWYSFDLSAGKGRAIATLVNGKEAEFSQPLANGDNIELYWKEN